MNREDVEREIVYFYKHLYTDLGRFRPQLWGIFVSSMPMDKFAILEAMFIVDEIRAVVGSMSGDRAPGPYGFPISFFLKDDLYILFADFFLKMGLMSWVLLLFLLSQSR